MGCFAISRPPLLSLKSGGDTEPRVKAVIVSAHRDLARCGAVLHPPSQVSQRLSVVERE